MGNCEIKESFKPRIGFLISGTLKSLVTRGLLCWFDVMAKLPVEI